ncbi:unnamed protein product [Prunus brigantina]
MKLQPGIHIAYKASVCHSTTLWHRRLGHLNISSLRLLQEQDMVAGLPEIKAVKGVCEGCVLGKQCREAFPREATTKASTPLELIHSYVCGPMQTTTKARNRYFLTSIDDCTRTHWVFFLMHKYEVLSVFKRFKAIVELQSGYKLKKLRSDRGEEYTSMEFDRFCEDVGMERQLTTPYTPQQNGVAERKNRTIVEMAKCLMLEKKISFEFWVEAVNTSVYILNRCPTKALLKKTPFEAYSGRKPGIKHLRKGYRLYNIETGKVIVSRDDVFNEDACWDWNTQEEKSVRIQITEASEGEQGHEGSSCDSVAQCGASEVLSSSTEIYYQERMAGPQDINTPLKYKSLVEVYEKCNLCIIEPEIFEEANEEEA